MSMLTSRSRAYHFGPTQDADHFVYRCYDADDRLLYIGCTANVRRRMNAHQRGQSSAVASRWLAACMVRYEVTGPFAGREAGRAVEALAIAAEQPLFNTQERCEPIWRQRNWVGRYLVERGLRELAIATACTCWPEDREVGVPAEWCSAHEGMDRL